MKKANSYPFLSIIELWEGADFPLQTGYFVSKDIEEHDENGPHNMAEYVSGKGTKMAGTDIIGGYVSEPTFADGTLTFELDWRYGTDEGSIILIKSVDQVYTLEVDDDYVKFTIEKGGSGYYLSTEDCILHSLEEDE